MKWLAYRYPPSTWSTASACLVPVFRYALEHWAARIKTWRSGDAPASEHSVTGDGPHHPAGRDVYVYFDNDVKTRAPYDAIALAERVRD